MSRSLRSSRIARGLAYGALVWIAVHSGAWSWGLAAEVRLDGNPAALTAAIEKMAQQPPDPQQAVTASRDRLEASLARLDQLLARSGAEVSNGWSDWLELPALKAELTRSQPDAARAKQIEERYYRNHVGLEMPAFLAVREDLRGFVAACEYAAAAQPDDAFRERLAELGQRLARLDTAPTGPDAQRAGAITAWIERISPDGARLASVIRERYRRPNALAQTSGRFVNVLLSQNVQERHYVSDIILGSVTHGPAFTSGHVSFGVVPNSARGALEIRLRAQTQCPANVAERGRISIYSSAFTATQANKRIFFSDHGLELTPAVALSRTEAQITDVAAGSRLLERIAWRRANKLLPQAEADAGLHAQMQAGSRLDQQADAALGGVNDLFRQQLRASMIRLGALPAQWRFWTDENHLRMELMQASDAQLAVASAAPHLRSHYDLAICGHESMVNNLGETMLGGRTVHDKAWLELMNLLTGSSPRPLWVHDRAERWSVTFARDLPLQAQCAGDRLKLTLRFTGLTRSEKHFGLPFEVEARLKPETTRDGPAFIRDGDLIIRFDNVEAAAAADGEEAQQRVFLERKFGAILPAELHFNGLAPPAGGSLGRLRKLHLAEFSSVGGWLTLAYQLDAPSAAE